jgi:uncharacterized membrane protein
MQPEKINWQERLATSYKILRAAVFIVLGVALLAFLLSSDHASMENFSVGLFWFFFTLYVFPVMWLSIVILVGVNLYMRLRVIGSKKKPHKLRTKVDKTANILMIIGIVVIGVISYHMLLPVMDNF